VRLERLLRLGTEDRVAAPDPLLASLREAAYLDRASAHVAAGRSPKAPEFAVKAALGLRQFVWIDRAHRLLREIETQARFDGPPPAPAEGFRRALRRIDRAASTADLVAGLFGTVRPHVGRIYARALPRLDPIVHAHLVPIVREGIAAAREERAIGRRLLARAESRPTPAFRRDLGRLWRRRGEGRPVRGAGLWSPVDRVPRAARPAGADRGAPGALIEIPLDSFRTRDGIGLFFHNNANAEYGTLEIVARSSYEHPGMPEAFHLAVARHASDEARHALLMERWAARFGVPYGSRGLATTAYDLVYEFGPCPRGGRRELLWRLLIKSTVQEGIALDDFAMKIRQRRWLGQRDLAAVFAHLYADEIFHCANGLRWARFLCGGDERRVRRERERARACYERRIRDRRLGFVGRRPRAAAAEEARLIEVDRRHRSPFRLRIDRRGRRLAGFTGADVAQAVRWGDVEA
jgi:uncharacterized ferritin-like protein (DUF455 family)